MPTIQCPNCSQEIDVDIFEEHVLRTDNPHQTTKEHVGLDEVDNVSIVQIVGELEPITDILVSMNLLDIS